MTSALLMTVLALSVRAEKTAAQDPSEELIRAACGQGLLVRAPDGDKSAAALARDASRDFPDLLGAPSADAGAPAPKARLLRPRKDHGRCPEQARSFYAAYGRRLNAVPAPNVPTDQIDAHLDRVFALAAGSGRKKRLAKLTDGDLSQRRQAVDALFDGASSLGEADFSRISANQHGRARSRAAAIAGLRDGTGTMPGPDGLPAVYVAAVWHPQTAAPTPASNQGAMTTTMRQRYSPDSGGAGGNSARRQAPPAVIAEPAPRVASWMNDHVPDFAWRASAWTADRVWGEGNPSINVELQPGIGTPPTYRRVRYGYYGTAAMVSGLIAVAGEMGQMGAQTIDIGDISLKGGGMIAGHKSHRRGKDVDIYFLKDAGGRFDTAWNLLLAAETVKHMNVTHIFVDTKLKDLMTRYLASAKDIPAATRTHMTRALQLMSYEPNHDNHFHVRIDY